MSTEMQYLWTVVVDGKSLGVFDSLTGGDAVASESKHRPGGMGDEESYPSLPSYGPASVARVYKRQRDHELIRTLTAKAGRVSGSVTEQPLDADGNSWGQPTVYKGRFLGVKRGSGDSTSDSPRMFELDFSITSIT